MDRPIESRTFNQGYHHRISGSSHVDLDFISAARKRPPWRHGRARGADAGEVVAPPAAASSTFSGDHYAAGYYSLWSEVLAADAFNAFEETGDVFDAATAKRLRDHIYAAGGARDPSEAYRAFRGRMPAVDPLPKKRGLIAESA